MFTDGLKEQVNNKFISAVPSPKLRQGEYNKKAGGACKRTYTPALLL